MKLLISQRVFSWTDSYDVYDENGNVKMVDTVDLGLTIDERLADGYYYSKTIRLLKKLLENPELLEENLTQEVDSCSKNFPKKRGILLKKSIPSVEASFFSLLVKSTCL